ncbi:MAG: porin family protein [Bdellovibrionaceae bacterium]|nr:porin family protein [Pseudobdellovibrionaceae bacterium]
MLSLLPILFTFVPISEFSHALPPPLLVSQAEDEAFDPFSDYSAFEDQADEEADINFFRYGRFITFGASIGTRSGTQNFARAYSQAPVFGVTLGYFYDLRWSFVLGFFAGDHNIAIPTENNNVYRGNVGLTQILLNFRYYTTSQTSRRTVANFNPYLQAGFSQWYRTYSISGMEDITGNTMGFDAGVGIEIPVLRNKNYIGLGLNYHLVNFSDENKMFIGGTEKLKYTISGDFYDVVLSFGLNF